jgi:hypothetical protein
MNAHRADFNMHKTSSKSIQNKYDDKLNDLEPKYKNFKDQYKTKEQVKKFLKIRRHMSILLAFD